MVKERDRRRREILAALCRAGLRTRLYQCSAPPVVARPRCLTALVGDLVDAGADRLVLERLETQQHSDRRTIRAALAGVDAVLPYVHLRAYEEPLLWAPDALAWAYSAGGDWRRRVDPLVDKAVLLDP
jgi:predicted kinase